jgi:hypothetical protein
MAEAAADDPDSGDGEALGGDARTAEAADDPGSLSGEPGGDGDVLGDDVRTAKAEEDLDGSAGGGACATVLTDDQVLHGDFAHAVEAKADTDGDAENVERCIDARATGTAAVPDSDADRDCGGS